MRGLAFSTAVDVAVAGACGAVSSIALSTPGAPGETVRPALVPGIMLAQAKEPVAVSIVEPPLRPPPTWTYEPKVVTIAIGTKIVWTNDGAVVHTVTADDGKTFDSGNLHAKATFGFTPSAPGTFAYHCKQHPWMKATLIVQP